MASEDWRSLLPSQNDSYGDSVVPAVGVCPEVDELGIDKREAVVLIGKMATYGAYPTGQSRVITGLYPDLVGQEFPKGETLKLANLFISKFMKAKGEFLASEVPSDRMATFITDNFMDEPSGLCYRALAALGSVLSSQGCSLRDPQEKLPLFLNARAANPNTCTFFTPVGELGFALHEMHEVSVLLMGDRPYEEHIPGTEKVHLLKKYNP